MINNTIENITENLFFVLPIIHKKLLKIEPPDPKPPVNLSRIQVGIMAIIKDEKALPISEIARRLLIPKPQMTQIIKHLVDSGLVEKQSDPRDGRVTNVLMTHKGDTALTQVEEFLKNNVRKNLSCLSEKELEELSQILIKLRELGRGWRANKIQNNV